jgi:hypothetical protein
LTTLTETTAIKEYGAKREDLESRNKQEQSKQAFGQSGEDNSHE